MEMRKTVNLMLSYDYKERFLAEYLQTKERYERLKSFNNKIEAAARIGGEGPKHDCPAGLLREQQKTMGEYLHILEVRAEIEGIDLNAPLPEGKANEPDATLKLSGSPNLSKASVSSAGCLE